MFHGALPLKARPVCLARVQLAYLCVALCIDSSVRSATRTRSYGTPIMRDSQ